MYNYAYGLVFEEHLETVSKATEEIDNVFRDFKDHVKKHYKKLFSENSESLQTGIKERLEKSPLRVFNKDDRR